MSSKPQNNDQRRQAPAYIKYTGLGFQMLAIIAAGTFGGIKLDERLKTGHTFTIILSLLSVILGLGLVVKDFLKK